MWIEAVDENAIPVDDGAGGIPNVPNPVPAVLAGLVLEEHVVVRCGDLDPPLVIPHGVVAHHIPVRAPGNIDPARVRAKVVDRDVVLDEVVIGVDELDAIVYGGGQDVAADCAV